MNSLKVQNGHKGKRKRSPSPFDKKKLIRLTDNETKGLESSVVKKNEMIKMTGFTYDNEKLENNQDEMWVNKYKPKTLNKIINQNTPQSCANKLKNWLNNWFKNKNVKPVYNRFGNSSSNDSGIGMKAALLSGSPGIGKTTTAQLVAKECGFEFVEFNASDTRNKRSMDEQVQTLLNNKTLDGFFHDRTNQTKITSKHVLIMDEVDGMSGADRGGIAELIQFIKKTQIPIICICNDRNSPKIRSLANYCFDLRFQKPRVEQIRSMVLSICFKEGVKVDVKLINEIIEMSNYDIRQIIHYFSVFASKNKNLNEIKSHKIVKDVVLGPFDATKKIFTAGQEYDSMSFDERTNLFFNDYQLIPLFVWENYSQCRPSKSKNDLQTLSLAAKSIDALCIGDLIETQIRTTQNWSLLPFQAAFSTVMPGHYMNGHFGGSIQFPSLLGKISSTNKKDRLVQELKQHMNLKISGSKTCLNFDYVLPLRDKIIQPLLRNEKDAIDKAIVTLNHYCLLKDDLQSIIELSLWRNEKSPFDRIDTKTKSAFTRAYNKTANQLPYAEKDQIKKIGKGKKGLDISDDENDNDLIENEDDFLPEF